jgi:hypothetical protein
VHDYIQAQIHNCYSLEKGFQHAIDAVPIKFACPEKTLLLFLGLCSAVCRAQTDSIYVKSYPQKWAIKGFLLRNFIQVQDGEKEYKPNNPVNAGLGISMRNIVLFMGIYGLNSTKNKELGEVKDC